MKARILVGILVAAFVLAVPLTAHAANSPAAGGVVTADILFEATAPYYQPHIAVVSTGMPVRWSNATASPHSIRHDGCLTEGGPCVFQSIAVPPDDSVVIAPLPPGRYSYHCELHPIMRGTLMIVDPQTASVGTGSLTDVTK